MGKERRPITLRALLVAALVALCSAGPLLAAPRVVEHEELLKALQRSRGLDGFEADVERVGAGRGSGAEQLVVLGDGDAHLGAPGFTKALHAFE